MDATSITLDPIHVPSIMLTSDELDEAERRIERNELPPDWFARYYKAVEENVYGVDFKRDGKGRPVESGRGSATNQTHASVEAYKKWGKDEPDYEKNLARMQRELEQCEALRAATAAKAPTNKWGRRGAV